MGAGSGYREVQSRGAPEEHLLEPIRVLRRHGELLRGDGHRLDSARYMQMRAIPTSGLGGNSELDETLRAADQDLARYGYY